VREVIISFGNATLLLSDQHEEPLSHWAMAATLRIAWDGEIAIYSPDADGRETLEIDDVDMVEAIAQVSRAENVKNRRKPWRIWMTMLVVLAILGAGMYWAPQLVRDQALRMTNAASARQIGLEMLGALQIEICKEPRADAVRMKLQQRLFPTSDAHLVIAKNAPAGTVFPGRLLLIGKDTLLRFSTSDQFILWAAQLQAEEAPDTDLFQNGTLADVAHYVTRGNIPRTRLLEMANQILDGGHSEVAYSQEFASLDIRLRPQDWTILKDICLE
jgi:elongation factor P hydroxylase